MISREQAKPLPSTFGVYLFKNGDEVLYVGKSVNIKARVNSHIENAKLDRKEHLIVSNSDKIEFILTDNEFKALILESELIKKFTPKYNVRWRDNKSYLYIKITVDEVFPKVLISRREKKGKAQYFGPFSSTALVRDLISDIRHIVPFCTQPSVTRNSCFYSKIHLCDPCPNSIRTLSVGNEYEIKKKQYRSNIARVIRILRGGLKTFLADLYRDLKKYSREQKYEEAIKIRNKIFRMERLIHYPLTSHDFHSSPDKDFVQSLLAILNQYFPNMNRLRRIETYDISNLGEKNQTASMVVATDGRIDKSQYRKFRIENPKLRSDFERLKEVIGCRLRQKWTRPDLMVIDGGQPQLEAVSEILKAENVMIPLIGIAKNPDRLVVGVGNYPVVRPPIRNPGFSLIRLMRDESHRFARKYHLQLRERDFLI